MTQEDKQLLLRDLCGRLPYGVKVTYNISGNHFGTISKICEYKTDYNIFKVEDGYNVGGYSIKPYLRSMSSITEEEREYLKHHVNDDFVDYCNEHYIDFRGLIPMGLALEAPKDMYKTK